ncbi:MAG: fused MFS/spermidine synthase [Deltaproteobacteria bacterium]|nr:fused MFS/spermidine synthase [Deltaproteobacteria bacterium]
MLGHYPALFHPNAKSVLVVGFGAGITAGSLVLHPSIERIVICEIEPLVPRAAGEHFRVENYDVLNDPRVEVIFDDARHFIATTDETFDIITADPIHPWMDGSAVLYSTEYYELVKKRLATGGLMAQWVPVYETDEETVRSEIGTFMQVFPEGTLWSSHIPQLGGNDLVMIGRVGPMKIDVAELSARIERSPELRASLAEVDLGYMVTLLASYIGRGPDLSDWLEGAEINHERSLRLQYLAGMSYEVNRDREIYRAIAQHRTYPDTLFDAPKWIENRLKSLWF